MSEPPLLKPIDASWPEVRVAAKIDLFRMYGIPWDAIAKDLGLKDKREVKRLRDDLGRKITARQLAGNDREDVPVDDKQAPVLDSGLLPQDQLG